jgi:hypothetical protein
MHNQPIKAHPYYGIAQPIIAKTQPYYGIAHPIVAKAQPYYGRKHPVYEKWVVGGVYICEVNPQMHEDDCD